MWVHIASLLLSLSLAAPSGGDIEVKVVDTEGQPAEGVTVLPLQYSTRLSLRDWKPRGSDLPSVTTTAGGTATVDNELPWPTSFLFLGKSGVAVVGHEPGGDHREVVASLSPFRRIEIEVADDNGLDRFYLMWCDAEMTSEVPLLEAFIEGDRIEHGRIQFQAVPAGRFRLYRKRIWKGRDGTLDSATSTEMFVEVGEEGDVTMQPRQLVTISAESEGPLPFARIRFDREVAGIPPDQCVAGAVLAKWAAGSLNMAVPIDPGRKTSVYLPGGRYDVIAIVDGDAPERVSFRKIGILTVPGLSQYGFVSWEPYNNAIEGVSVRIAGAAISIPDPIQPAPQRQRREDDG